MPLQFLQEWRKLLVLGWPDTHYPMTGKLTQTAEPASKKLRSLSTAIIAGLLALAALAGFLLNRLGFPGAWLIGPMFIGIIYTLHKRKTYALPPLYNTAGKGVIAIGIAVRFVPETLETIYQYAIPLLCCVAITSGLSILNGYWLWRWTDLDRPTSLLASVPGAAPSIIAMAEDMGANAVIVSLFHSMRVFLVTFLVPAIASRLDTDVNSVMVLTPPGQTLLSSGSWAIVANFALLIVCSALGNWIGKKLAFPSASFLSTVVIGIVVSWNLPAPLAIPYWLFATALLSVGLTVGLQFNLQKIGQLVKAAVVEVLLILGLILSCLLIGYGFHQVTQVDVVTAVLGSTPGAISAMVGIAVDVGGDAGLVFSMQITRLLLLIFVSTLLGGFWRKKHYL